MINLSSAMPADNQSTERTRSSSLMLTMYTGGEPHDGCSCNHRQHGRGRRWAHFNISVGVP